MQDKKSKKNHILFSLIVALVTLCTFFALLRKTHVILRVGEHYTTCFSTHFSASNMGSEDFNDDNISEIVYMKNLRSFSSTGANITNVDFISKFTKLETFILIGDMTRSETMIKHIPSLGNSPKLDYVYVASSINNLDFLADSEHLKRLTAVAYESILTDISGLKNKPDLKTIDLQNVRCSDFSILLDLPSLEAVILEGTILPDKIKDGLEKKGVSIDNCSDDRIYMIQCSLTGFVLPEKCSSPKSISIKNTKIDCSISKNDDEYTLYNSKFLSDLDTVKELSIYVDVIEDVSGVCEMDSLQTFRVNKGSLSDEDKELLKDKDIDVIEE